MSGILSSEKRTSYRILSEEFPQKLLYDCLYRYDNSFLSEDIEAKLNKFNSLDTASDDKLSKTSWNQSNNIKRYFQKDGKVYSIYESIFFRPNQSGLSNKYAVFLMSTEGFAGAIINNGDILLKKAFYYPSHDGTSKKSSRRGTEKLLSDISTLLKSWKEEFKYMDVAYVHCTTEHGKFLREEINNIDISRPNIYIQKVPFIVNGISIEELSRIGEKLFSVVEHGSTQSFIKALETGQMNKIADIPEDSEQSSNIESTKQQRRDEKQRWPGITPQKKIELNEALISNHYERLQDLVEKNQEIIDYLSTTHEKLGGQNYMHYATKENLIESVEFLLNVGCDSSICDNTSKVPYEYAKTIEMKQTFVDFMNEHSEGRQWTKSRVPEELQVPSPPKSSKPNNRNNADNPKSKGTTGKSKRKQKYVDMIDDEFDYDDYDYEDESEERIPASSGKSPHVNNLEAEKDQESEESDPETTLKTHSLLEDEWRPTEFQYTRSFWTSTPLKTVETAKVECKKLRKFLEKRLQASVRTYFSDREVLYSGYSAILGGYFTLHNRAFKPHAVILINDEYFAGAAFDNGKACRRKTLYRNSANWTKIRDFTKGNLVQNRFIDEKLSNCIQNVMNYWAAEVEIKVLYSCPTEFEWFLKEHILECSRYAKFECIPFRVKSYTIPEINRIWKKITKLTEHGQLNTFERAVEEKDYENLEKILVDRTEVVLPSHNERIWQELTADQRKEIHKTVLKNDYKAMKSVVADHYWYIYYLKNPHAKFRGETFLQFAKRENLDEIVKFLEEKGIIS